MFDQKSRYYNLSTSIKTVLSNSGKKIDIRYVKRRMLPSPDSMTVITDHIVKPEDRLDNIASIYMGDATQFWQLCDANETMQPEVLTETPGQVIKISMPNL